MAAFIPNVTLVAQGCTSTEAETIYVCVCPLNHTQPGQGKSSVPIVRPIAQSVHKDKDIC